MSYAEVDGQRLYYEDSGGDGPVILLSHGFLMDHEMFAPQVEALAPEFRVITWDQRGFGDTEFDGKPFTYWDSARDCLGLLDHLGIEQAVLGGMSQGGYVSVRAALLAPERVKALVLIATQAQLEDPENVPMFEGMLDAWATEGPTDALVEAVARILTNDPAHDARWIAKWQARPRELIVEPGRCLRGREDDVSRRLGEITCPAVVFHGTEDPAIPMSSAEHLAAGLPGCDGVIAVGGAAHAANLTHPEHVNPVLLAFLRRLPGADREARVRQELAKPVCAETHDAIRKLWIQHSKAELAHDVDGLLATLVPDCCYEMIPTGQRWTGLVGARSFYSGIFDAFPDVEFLATDLVIGPQGVVVVADMTATHLGTWMGVAPTGKRISCPMVARFRWDADAGKFGGERIWFADNGGLLGMVTAEG